MGEVTGVVSSAFLLFSLSTAIGVYLSATSRRSFDAKEVKATANVKELVIYPIKSCKGISLSTSQVTKRGLRYDRQFVLVDSNGRFASQRKFPSMALIVTTIDETRRLLHISAPNMPIALTVSLDERIGEESQSVQVNVWGDMCEGWTVGDVNNNNCPIVVGQWFDDFLSTSGLKLVRMKDSFVRRTDADYSTAGEGQTGFADGFPFLLTSIESLQELNRRLALKSSSDSTSSTKSVNMDCFRPNIVVSHGHTNADSLLGDDHWHHIRIVNTNTLKSKQENTFNSNNNTINSWTAEIVKPCSRCTMPNIDQSTAEVNAMNEPTKTMQTFRTGADLQLKNDKWKKAVFFGQNVDHYAQENVFISVGDRIEVLSLK